MMKLIIGLGNPGLDYIDTRHNAGFLFVDELLRQKLPQGVVIKKSGVFMNESGEFVKQLKSKYPGISASDIYIIHDDLDIKLGEYKIQLGHSPKDHNGARSVDAVLGTNEYWHVKIGIDNRPLDSRPMGIEYVLQKFTDEERKTIDTVINKAVKELCKKLAIH